MTTPDNDKPDLPPDPETGPDTHAQHTAEEMRALAGQLRKGMARRNDPAAVAAYFAADLLRGLADRLEAFAAVPESSRHNGKPTHARVQPAPDVWQATTALRQQLEAQAGFVQRRLRGEYHTDPYGTDMEIIERMRPFFRFLYRTWWRIKVEGLEHVPATGRALLVANHSGVLPWDASMITTAVFEDHPAQQGRLVRNLFLHWFSSQPFLAPLFTSLGQMVGVPENATRLLEEDELVCVFPEGEKGICKLFRERYQLARFGRGGFVRIALRTGAPIIPVAVVGAEEIYPMFANSKTLANLLNLPFFPITLTFPWLGPLGVIPFPTRWSITFCPPISLAAYGPEAADDPLLVLKLTEQVRGTIQQTLNTNLAARTSLF